MCGLQQTKTRLEGRKNSPFLNKKFEQTSSAWEQKQLQRSITWSRQFFEFACHLQSRAKFEQSVDIYIYKLKLVFPRISELVSKTEFYTMHQG